MARVFISYRRADGQYAVGWIEEVLRRLETVADVRTAFRDSDLRHGDDFPQQLADEVNACDVLIAVIGPHWRGERPDGSARILERFDWVGREIDAALQLNKRIIPVLLDGVEPLQASDLLPEHRELADLHALRFNEAAALGVLMEDVKSHLEEIDAELAMTRGLEQPIDQENMSMRATLTTRLIGLALLAGLLGLGLGAGMAMAPPSPSRPQPNSDPNWNWLAWSIIQVSLWGMLATVGFAHFRRVAAPHLVLRWKAIAQSAGLAAVLVALTVIAFGPGEHNQVGRTLIHALLAIGVLGPWICMLLAPHVTRPARTTIGERARIIALERHLIRQATPALVIAVVPAVFTTASLLNADDPAGGEFYGLVALGVFLTLIVAAGAYYSHARLLADSSLLATEVSDLARPYRQYAEDVLITDHRDLWSWVSWWALVPTVAAVAAAAVGSA